MVSHALLLFDKTMCFKHTLAYISVIITLIY